MRTRELLRRMDARTERSDETLRRIDGTMRGIDGTLREIRGTLRHIDHEIELTRDEVELTRQEVELSRKSREDLRDFIREMVRRMEQSTRAHVAELSDLRAESRAQREALLRMIDRMDRFGPGGAEAAG